MSPQETLARFAASTAMVVGDVMLDAYLWGEVSRISPEAPVPVVRVTGRSSRLGGAANVALNLRALGANTILAGVVGNDASAAQVEELLTEHGIDSSGIMRSHERPTTVKTRIISAHQHVVRVDEEEDEDLNAKEEKEFLDTALHILHARRPDVLVLEDYDKGVLTPVVIAALVNEAGSLGIPVAVDPKKRHFFDFKGVDLFKPNLKELREGLKTEVDGKDLASVRAATLALEEKIGNKASLITLSEHGAYIHDKATDRLLPAHRRSIADVSGAGDTVIAVAALCLAAGLPMHLLAAWSNLAGGMVCEHVGVVPVDPVALQQEAERLGIAEAERK
ncbi:MAG: D-glycero-beta-D-manno-heptose-7-phosphate kinase [Flavobacteriales bacterium]|nr:D-glycero-beta-D-manno-heptose-7-phosphate kinase [Flavobacteriales bacterium]